MNRILMYFNQYVKISNAEIKNIYILKSLIKLALNILIYRCYSKSYWKFSMLKNVHNIY